MAFNVITTVNLDMASPNAIIVNAVQYDSSGRVIKANLLNNGSPWTVPLNCYPIIRYRKSDRIGGFYDTDENDAYAISFENNRQTVNITLALQVLTTVGNVDVQINFYNTSGQRVTSFAFKVRVQASVVPDTDIVSSEYYNALTATLRQVVQAGNLVESANRAEIAATSASSSAAAASNAASNAASEVMRTVPAEISTWLAANMTNPSNPAIDKSLAVSNAAADSKTVGDIALKNVGVAGYFGTYISDANDAAPNSCYKIYSNEAANYPSNLPSAYFSNVYLWTFSHRTYQAPNTQRFDTQLITDTALNVLYYRSRNVGFGTHNWKAWKKNAQNPKKNQNMFELFFNFSSEDNNLFDNELVRKNYYAQYSDGGVNALPASSGFGYVKIPISPNTKYTLANGVASIHIAFYNSENIGVSTYISGILTSSDLTEFTSPANAVCVAISYKYAEQYNIWFGLSSNYVKPQLKNTVSSTEIVHVAKDGSGKFSKITDALAYGMEHENLTIIVEDGEYNIIEELGSSYFENFNYVAYSNMGPKIGNGTHLIFSSNAKVLCHYTGNNQQVITGFAPFNSVIDSHKPGAGDYIIENMTAEASNVRYIIHDDNGAQTIPTIHKYKRCKFSIPNTYAIGAGFGRANDILVEDCLVTSSGTSGMLFHTGDGTLNNSSKCSLVIKNCYFANGLKLHIASNGPSTKETPVIICGNRLGAEIEKVVNPNSQDNMKIYAWNNQIGS